MSDGSKKGQVARAFSKKNPNNETRAQNHPNGYATQKRTNGWTGLHANQYSVRHVAEEVAPACNKLFQLDPPCDTH